jgi:hypothetical protein
VSITITAEYAGDSDNAPGSSSIELFVSSDRSGRCIELYGGAINHNEGLLVSGPYWQFPAPDGGQGHNEPMDIVEPQSWVYLWANVTYNYWPVQYTSVNFEIQEPNGTVYTRLSTFSDTEGVAGVGFSMPWPSVCPESLLGTWNIFATAQLADIVVNDTMQFEYDYLLHFWQVTTETSTYQPGQAVDITALYGSYAELTYPILLKSSIRDTLNVTVGTASFSSWVGRAYLGQRLNFTAVFTVEVPVWAALGEACVFTDAFNGTSPGSGNSSVSTEHVGPLITLVPAPLYNVLINAHCDGEDAEVNVGVAMDGSPTGYNTPHMFVDVSGSHTFSVPRVDADGRQFDQWSTGEAATTIRVNSSGEYTAYYVLHDLAVKNVVPCKTVICQSYDAKVLVTLANLGDFTEVFNVILYAGATAIGTRSVSLSSSNQTLLVFNWNTTGFSYGNYTVTACVSPVLGEPNMANNNYTGSWVTISLMGDLTGKMGWPDGKVDKEDVDAVCKLFGISYPTPGYNLNCDINGDLKTDMKDIGIVARQYGQHYP